ncbi:hypothetical protein KFL_000500350 [Klebsormidium nitens]|uniref:PDZ domain-containing protein n=1 Tax=Klebsormidium nitens TaxID=105231 RepID=A0A1Y1HR55_KLENI|nr:hypothetical protein KFL_000500350 [Klebsormidium nitens]|eukprot:GAQ80282.1 hypothetical protein KFL_000500350 [Klebsormidium nitens]
MPSDSAAPSNPGWPIQESCLTRTGRVVDRENARSSLLQLPLFRRRTCCSKRSSSLQSLPRPAHKSSVRCQSTADPASEVQTGLVGGQPDIPPPGCSRVKLTLGKPLGIVLEEDKAGNIFIAEVFPEGNAFKSGLVDVGDQLIAVSAVVYNTSERYGEVEVQKGQEKVRLSVRGESFKTVMAAIGSHPAYIKVDLEIQKCEPTTSSGQIGS